MFDGCPMLQVGATGIEEEEEEEDNRHDVFHVDVGCCPAS
jgi:hypothetical protein